MVILKVYLPVFYHRAEVPYAAGFGFVAPIKPAVGVLVSVLLAGNVIFNKFAMLRYWIVI